MAKFRLLFEALNGLGLAESSQMHAPLPVPRRWLETVHQRHYHEAFARGTLDRQAQRRIGLPATTPLVQRTWLAVGERCLRPGWLLSTVWPAISLVVRTMPSPTTAVVSASSMTWRCQPGFCLKSGAWSA